MWSDNQTDRDLLNFRHVADIAAERIFGAAGQPLSIGISGGWGMGKSSMMELLRIAIQDRIAEQRAIVNVSRAHGDEGVPETVRFVHFNPWTYQGFDDTRAALMETITRSLADHAEKNKKGLGDAVVEKIWGLVRRTRWFRLAGMAGGAALAMHTGDPTPLAIGSAMSAMGGVLDGDLSKDDADKLKKAFESLSKEGKTLLKNKKEEQKVSAATPPKAIDEFRADLEAVLAEMKVTLVVLIDDLDRCLPETAIGTLEAMRLFLFLKRTAFVIAADEEMIRESVRIHFHGARLSEAMVRSYFDKLIQLSLRVPPLGTQDVRAYLMLLFIEASDLREDAKETVREKMGERLGQTWTGARLDRAFVLDLLGEGCPSDLRARIALADRIAPILTNSAEIRGNPRLIKRFLNSLALRAALAERQKVTVDEEVLMKLLLFERCGSADAYAALIAMVNAAADGHPARLREMEQLVRSGAETRLDKPWDEPFVQEWLALDPPLGDKDLRAAAYISRDSIPIISVPDDLSAEAVDLLEALLVATQPSPPLAAKLKELPYREQSAIMDRMVAKAGDETRWGVPAILNAALDVATADPRLAAELSSFLNGRPSPQLEPSIIPRIASLPWAKDLFRLWSNRADLPDPMKKRLTRELKA